MNEWISAGIGVLASLLGIYFGYCIFKRNQKNDIEADTKESATMVSDIGYIKAGIDDLKRKQEKQDERFIEIVTRLTAVEASAKQAHKRLDEVVVHGKES